jgi:hypothetical protein
MGEKTRRDKIAQCFAIKTVTGGLCSHLLHLTDSLRSSLEKKHLLVYSFDFLALIIEHVSLKCPPK